MNLKQKLVLTLVGIGILTNNLQALSIGELIEQEPRRIKATKGLVPGSRILNLSNMGITSLQGLGDIPGIEHVTRLYLNNNNIEAIESGDFAAAINLQVLTLAKNNLSEIHPNAFAGLKQLKVLDLSNNTIESIPQGGLNGMPNLRFLRMSNNPIPNPNSTLQPQVPKALITTLSITKANIKKWTAIVGATIAALIATLQIKKNLQRRRLEQLWAEEDKRFQDTLNKDLLSAAANGNNNMVDMLLDPRTQGTYKEGLLTQPGPTADINTADEEGNTPLMLAAKNNHLETVELLLEKGAKVNTRNNQGRTALDLTTESTVVDLLLINGCEWGDFLDE